MSDKEAPELGSPCEAPELGSACIRMMRALARRAGQGELEALEQLSFLQDSLQLQLGAAVAGYRAGPAEASWTAVGEILGMTRQSAQGRFGRASYTPAHGLLCICNTTQCPNTTTPEGADA